MAVVQVHCAKQLPRTVRAAAPSCPAPRGVAEALGPCRHPQPGSQLWGASRKLDVGARGSAMLGAAQIAPSAEEQPPQEQSVAPPAQQHLLHVPVLPPCHHQPQTPEVAVRASVPPAPVPKQSRNQRFPKPGGLFINKQISAQTKHNRARLCLPSSLRWLSSVGTRGGTWGTSPAALPVQHRSREKSERSEQTPAAPQTAA